MQYLHQLASQGIGRHVQTPHGSVQPGHALDVYASPAHMPASCACVAAGSGSTNRLVGKEVEALMKQELTAARVREALNYEPATGVFTWAIKRKGTKGIGREAGGSDADGYLRIRLDYQEIKAHRLAWLYVHGVWPFGELDHINQIKTDNRIANLREVTRSENLQNRGQQKNNSSGYRGVNWEARRSRWRASIAVNGKQKIIGRFLTPQEAYEAYCAAVQEVHTHNPIRRTADSWGVM